MGFDNRKNNQMRNYLLNWLGLRNVFGQGYLILQLVQRTGRTVFDVIAMAICSEALNDF